MSGESLYETLRRYSEGTMYPLHMPGHKRHLKEIPDSPYAIDITEIDGFDNLHHAQHVLKEAQEHAAALWGARRTWYLVGGSSAGILAGIAACANRQAYETAAGDAAGNTAAYRCHKKIVIARNCHKSVYFGAMLHGLDTVYVYPRPLAEENFELNGRIVPEDIARALDQNPEVSLVVVTSPSYDGVVSDIAAIARIVHERGALLLVDEAHGAHFGFHPAFPQSAIRLGADVVVQSLHKTLPALTQCALLHLCSSRVDEAFLARTTEVYQTSSPSYVLMASMDLCTREMEKNGTKLLEDLSRNLQRFYEKAGRMQYVHAWHADDPSRILVSASGYLSGIELACLLREDFGMETEMAAPSYVLCLMSVGDTREGFERLTAALWEIDQRIRNGEIPGENPGEGKMGDNGMPDTNMHPAVMPLYQAWNAPACSLPLKNCCQKISTEFVYLYPPGIPLVVPGEQLTEEIIRLMEDDMERGYSLQGMADPDAKELRVVRQ